MHHIPAIRPQNIELHEPAPNHGCCASISRVVTAVANFFRTIGLWLVEASSLFKDRVIDFFPEQIAIRLDPRKRFVRAILNIPADQRGDVLQQALPRISPQMNQNMKDQLIQLVNNENFASRDILRFITPDLYSPDSVETMEEIAAIPTEQRGAVMIRSDQLITGNLRGLSRRTIIAAIVARADRLITHAMSPHSMKTIYEAVSAVPAPRREEVVRNALLLIKPDMFAADKVSVIQTVAKIPANERDVVTAFAAQAITQDMQALSRQMIVEALVAVPALERAEVGRNALLLIKPGMFANDKVSVIQTVAKIPANQRDDVTALAVQAIPEGIGTHSIQMIVEALVAVPALERAEVGRNALLLIKPDMFASDRVRMIETVAKILPNQRDDVIDLAMRAIIQGMGSYSKKIIVEAVNAVPALERANVMEHALELINAHMHAQDRAMIIQNVAHVPANQRANYVQQRRQGQLAAHLFQNAVVAAEQGLNVHEGDRDQRVRAAIELLRQRQGPQITETNINQAVQAFTHYLNTRQMNAQHKELAKRALLAPRGLNEDFGPLINEDNFSIVGLLISGQELIGRLWIFASGLGEPDQTNAKNSMISALKDSYLMGSRVCNQGKTQRLIVGVLQGRLAGADVELIPEMQVPTHQAVRMFFESEAHQKIDELAALLNAANKFCDESPLVNREDFIAEIEAYAKETFSNQL